MPKNITLDALTEACLDTSFEDGIRIDSELEPIGGPGGPVKPAIYEGGRYQHDKRWASPADTEPTPVIVVDNVPAQANRLEDALRRSRVETGLPEFHLDLSELGQLPAHLPRQLSSLQFPHRNADAYLRDSLLDGQDFLKTEVGRSIFDATPQAAGPLVAWFPQALLYGFWQSHLGKKRTNTKHARAWVSEIIGWNPAAPDTRLLGLKGDALNLSVDESVTFDPADATDWRLGKDKKVAGAKHERLSEIGHGQVPFKGDGTPAAVSFARVTQRATVSFAQLRRVGLGGNHPADAAARALLVALGLHAHLLAFGRGFALRSGADLRPTKTTVTWLGGAGDEQCAPLIAEGTQQLLEDAVGAARQQGVALDGWGEAPTRLTPKPNLRAVISATWPSLED